MKAQCKKLISFPLCTVYRPLDVPIDFLEGLSETFADSAIWHKCVNPCGVRSDTSFACYWYPVTQYYLPQNHHCLVVALGEAKAMGVNPDRKSRVEPRRRLVEQCETFQQLLQLRWHRRYRLVLSVGPYQQHREGDPGDWAHHDFHIFRPGLHLERSLQLC